MVVCDSCGSRKSREATYSFKKTYSRVVHHFVPIRGVYSVLYDAVVVGNDRDMRCLDIEVGAAHVSFEYK